MTNKKHNYDWDAMGFDPNDDRIGGAFYWHNTPQGSCWWFDNEFTPEGQAEFASMKRLYAEDMAAAEGPVRTVTKKEIVPGVYGKVSVLLSDGVWLALTDDNDRVSHIKPSASELTDAIETLTEIRDALGE